VKKSPKIGLISVAAIVALVSSLALFTHARESAEDSIKGGEEHESAIQAFSENFGQQNSDSTNSTSRTTSEETGESGESGESGEAPGN
jgi:hypothetical protein